MIDWFATLGNGVGIVMVLSPIQVDGSIYTEQYIADLTQIKDSGLPNIVNSVARNQKIYSNLESHKDLFYDLIRHGVEKDGASGFDFSMSFYYNTALSQGQALDSLVANGSFTTIIESAETTQLTSEHSSFLNEIL